jgi:hypothetical protein
LILFYFFAENVTIITREESDPNGSLNRELNRYSILHSDSATGNHSMTLLGSPQTLPSDTIDFSVLLSSKSEDEPDKSSFLEPYDEFKYSAKTPDTVPLYVRSRENNSTESTRVSLPSHLNDKEQSPFVPESNITAHPLNSKDIMEINATKHETSSKTHPLSHSSRRTSNIHSGSEIQSTTSPDSYDELTTSSISDSESNSQVQNLSSQTADTESNSSLRREEAINPHALTTDMPVTHIMQHSPVSHADSHNKSDTSKIYETSSDSSYTNIRSFLADTTADTLLPQEATNNPHNEESQNSTTLKAHSFQQPNNDTVTNVEPNIATDGIVTSNNTANPFISGTVINPLPTSPTSNKNPKHLSDKGILMTAFPTYHPNDAIHVSSSELYPSDSIHNVSHREKHPCARACREGSAPMVCRYTFQLEWYYTMSKACYNCPLRLDDCNRMDCVVADGVRRPIVVVNRQMPGPSIEVSSESMHSFILKFNIIFF